MTKGRSLELRMTKIDIISGFLGAGKTTLIKKLLMEAFETSKTVLIENEFGEIGIDGGFMKELSNDKESGFEIREMNSGCICCSLSGDFALSLRDVMEKYQPEHIIIEPSGVGKLSDVIAAVNTITDGKEILLNRCITVVDAGKCKMYLKNFGEFYQNQIAHAETIIVSKSDRISEEKLTKSVALLRQENPGALIVTTPWNLIDGKFLLAQMEKKQNFEKEILKETSIRQEHSHEHGEHCEGHHEHGEHCECGCHEQNHHHHHAEEIFNSWGVETSLSYQPSRMEAILMELENEKEFGVVLRAKGMLSATNGQWIHFDYVPGEIDIRVGTPDLIGKICVIGSQLNEENLRKLFAV